MCTSRADSPIAATVVCKLHLASAYPSQYLPFICFFLILSFLHEGPVYSYGQHYLRVPSESSYVQHLSHQILAISLFLHRHTLSRGFRVPNVQLKYLVLPVYLLSSLLNDQARMVLLTSSDTIPFSLSLIDAFVWSFTSPFVYQQFPNTKMIVVVSVLS